MEDLNLWECLVIERGLHTVISKAHDQIKKQEQEGKPFIPEPGKRDANKQRIENAQSALEKIKARRRNLELLNRTT